MNILPTPRSCWHLPAAALLGAVLLGTGSLRAQTSQFTFTNLADTNTAAPGESSNFSGFYTPSLSNGVVVVTGLYNGNGGVGVFTASAASGVSTIIDSNATAAGHGAFTNFTSPTISGGNIVFAGQYSAGSNVLFDAVTNNNGTSASGLFLNSGGSVSEVLGVGDAFLGSTLSSYTFSPTAFDGNQFAFSYNLANGNQGIALVTVVPEPATWVVGAGLAGLTALAWGRQRWRRPA